MRFWVKSHDSEFQLIFGSEHDHYQLYRTGWDELERIHYCVFHLDIKNNKIWAQEDATDYDIVGELEAQGIPKEDIVLGFHAPDKRPYTLSSCSGTGTGVSFHAPYKRPYTGYAVA